MDDSLPVYRFAYSHDNVYGLAVELVEQHARRRGMHLDIGCGYGAVAEPLAERGFTYVGFDNDPQAVADLRQRGFDAYCADLADVGSFAAIVADVVARSPIASITMLDFIEHLTDAQEILAFVRDLAVREGDVPLVVSIPNVSHRDVGIKLLSDRWNYTPSGLLDYTHLRFFTASSMELVLERCGWGRVGMNDLSLEYSDQYFPFDSVVMSPVTNIGGFLRSVREAAGYGASVNQFIRAYLPRTPVDTSILAERDDIPQFELEAILSMDAGPAAVSRSIADLLAQTSQRFCVTIVADTKMRSLDRTTASSTLFGALEALGDRVRWVDTGSRRDEDGSVARPRGRYVAFVDNSMPLPADWVATYAGMIGDLPGKVLVARWPNRQRSLDELLFLDLALLEHAPIECFAFSRNVFTELGMDFPGRPGPEERVELIVRASLWCGVKWWTDTASSANAAPAMRSSGTRHTDIVDSVISRIDREPVVLPAGSLRQIRKLHDAAANTAEAVRPGSDPRLDELARSNRELRGSLDELLGSRSWRITRPIRRLSEVWRAVRSRPLNRE